MKMRFSLFHYLFVSALRSLFLLIIRLEKDRIRMCFFPTFFFLKRKSRKEKGLTPFSRKGVSPQKGAGSATKLTLVGTGTDGKAV